MVVMKLTPALCATVLLSSCVSDTPYEKAHEMLRSEIEGARARGNDWQAEVKLAHIEEVDGVPSRIEFDSAIHEIREEINGVLHLVPVGGPNAFQHTDVCIDGDPETPVDWNCDGYPDA